MRRINCSWLVGSPSSCTIPQSSTKKSSQFHLPLGPRFSPVCPGVPPAFSRSAIRSTAPSSCSASGTISRNTGGGAARYVGDGHAQSVIDDERAKEVGGIDERPRHLSRQLGEHLLLRLLVAGDLCAEFGEGVTSELRSELGESLALPLWCAPGVPHRFFRFLPKCWCRRKESNLMTPPLPRVCSTPELRRLLEARARCHRLLEPCKRIEATWRPPSSPSEEPKHSARTRAEKAARAARVAKEMRLNLLKRKAQQRAKRDQGKPG